MQASRGIAKAACWLLGLVLSFGLLLPLPAGRAQDQDVDLALVLAIDCSFSVDAHLLKPWWSNHLSAVSCNWNAMFD